MVLARDLARRPGGEQGEEHRLTTNSLRTACVAGLTGAALLSSSIPDAAAQDYYKGKTLTIYIGFEPGGSYDYYGRLLARHIGKHLPGAPTVVASSMPGAGGLRAANYLFAAAPKDGTAIGIVTQTLLSRNCWATPRSSTRPSISIGSDVSRMSPAS